MKASTESTADVAAEGRDQVRDHGAGGFVRGCESCGAAGLAQDAFPEEAPSTARAPRTRGLTTTPKRPLTETQLGLLAWRSNSKPKPAATNGAT